jgi:hypothetical protein
MATAWTPPRPGAKIPPVLDLTDGEPATAATACRAMPDQEGERAKKMDWKMTLKEVRYGCAARGAGRRLPSRWRFARTRPRGVPKNPH